MYDNDITQYIKSISKYKLLTSKEEIELNRLVKTYLVLNEAKKDFIEKNNREPSNKEWLNNVDYNEKSKDIPDELNEENINDLFKKGFLAREKMINCNLRFVVFIAKKYKAQSQGKSLSTLDLIQDGSIGLTKAVERFESDRGNKFSTYAYWWIKQAITRSISMNSRTIRLPLHIHEQLKVLKKARKELTNQFKRNPTYRELADYIDEEDFTVRKIRQLEMRTQRPRSLECPISTDTETNQTLLLDLIDSQPEESLTQAERELTNSLLRDDLEKALDKIIELFPDTPSLVKDVIILRYGLDGAAPQGRTLEEVSKVLDISRTEARSYESRGLRLLKSTVINKDLIDYVTVD